MRVLQINCVYQKGSTGKIVSDLHTGYQKSGMESYVLFGRGVGKNVNQDAHVEKVCSEGYAKAKQPAVALFRHHVWRVLLFNKKNRKTNQADQPGYCTSSLHQRLFCQHLCFVRMAARQSDSHGSHSPRRVHVHRRVWIRV